jgi:hypothetical protein
MIIGAASRLPPTPWFEIVKVPPRTSSGANFPGSRTFHDVGKALRNPEQVQCLYLTQHRHDQPLVAKRGADADVGIGVQLHRILVEGGINLGDRLQRVRACRDEIGRQGQAGTLRFERGGMRFAMRHDTGEIHFEQRGDMRRVQQTARHVFRDTAANRSVRYTRARRTDAPFCETIGRDRRAVQRLRRQRQPGTATSPRGA